MNHHFTYTLTGGEKEKLTAFYQRLAFKTIEQHPDWAGVEGYTGKRCYYWLEKDDNIVAAAVIREQYKWVVKNASVPFGPLFSDILYLPLAIDAIFAHCRQEGFTSVTIQPAMPTGTEADWMEYQVAGQWPVQYRFDRENWSSIRVDLSADLDTLLRNFSKGHKSDVKKAQKLQLQAVTATGDAARKTFIDIYLRMLDARGLGKNRITEMAMLQRAIDWIEVQQMGRLILVVNLEGQTLGGIIVLYQGDTVRYFKGAADPDVKGVPVLHPAMWEAMQQSKAAGFAWFDFWGYNHMVSEGDQVYNINKFKKGFGGSFVFYPKKMYLVFQPLKYYLFKLALGIKQKMGR